MLFLQLHIYSLKDLLYKQKESCPLTSIAVPRQLETHWFSGEYEPKNTHALFLIQVGENLLWVCISYFDLF